MSLETGSLQSIGITSSLTPSPEESDHERELEHIIVERLPRNRVHSSVYVRRSGNIIPIGKKKRWRAWKSWSCCCSCNCVSEKKQNRHVSLKEIVAQEEESIRRFLEKRHCVEYYNYHKALESLSAYFSRPDDFHEVYDRFINEGGKEALNLSPLERNGVKSVLFPLKSKKAALTALKRVRTFLESPSGPLHAPLQSYLSEQALKRARARSTIVSTYVTT